MKQGALRRFYIFLELFLVSKSLDEYFLIEMEMQGKSKIMYTISKRISYEGKLGNMWNKSIVELLQKRFFGYQYAGS